MAEKFKCPHCGETIEEVSIIEMTWKRAGVAAGLGIGCGLLVYPLMPESWLVGVVGAFIVGFVVTFLVTKERK